MTYHIYRPKNSDITYGISIRKDGAMLYQLGLGFGSFIWGEFNSDDLDKIIDQHLAELAEIDRAFEELDLKDLDPT